MSHTKSVILLALWKLLTHSPGTASYSWNLWTFSLADIQHWQTGDLLHANNIIAMASWQRVKSSRVQCTIKMASGVQDITCVFVEVAGSYEKKLQSYSLGWCVVHQWCQNVLVRLTGGWNYLD